MTPTMQRCGNCGEQHRSGSICPCQDHPSRPGVGVLVVLGVIAMTAVLIGLLGIWVVLGGTS